MTAVEAETVRTPETKGHSHLRARSIMSVSSTAIHAPPDPAYAQELQGFERGGASRAGEVVLVQC